MRSQQGGGSGPALFMAGAPLHNRPMPASSLLNASPEDVLAFWREAGPSRWFRKDSAFDEQFRDRFLATHEAALRGELDAWADDAPGALALLILLDQFPRNAFRATPRMFESDARALADRAPGRARRIRCASGNRPAQFLLPAVHAFRSS